MYIIHILFKYLKRIRQQAICLYESSHKNSTHQDLLCFNENAISQNVLSDMSRCMVIVFEEMGFILHCIRHKHKCIMVMLKWCVNFPRDMLYFLIKQLTVFHFMFAPYNKTAFGRCLSHFCLLLSHVCFVSVCNFVVHT